MDTLTFMLIAFYALPHTVLLQMIAVQYVFKVSYEVLTTPLTYLIVNRIKKFEQLDTFDDRLAYNPFSLRLSGEE